MAVGLGVEFSSLQTAIIADRGQSMLHELGIACPSCRTSDPAANMIRDGKYQTRFPNCPKCGGDGWLYRDGVMVLGLATAIRQQKNVIDQGIVEPGDMQFGIGPGFFACEHSHGHTRRLSQDDKFTQTWASALNEGQTIVRGAATMDDNVRFANNVNPDEDRLWYEPVYSLWCEDEDGKVYNEKGDFILGPGRVVKWIGARPPVGKKYVLKYTCLFEWLAFHPPQERYDRDNKDLGPLVFLRKRHVALVNESPVITAQDKIPLQSRVTC